jgi:RHS repeat-associated protein
VKSAEGNLTIVYIGGAYEYQAGAVTKYYAGAAMRRSGYPDSNGLFYLLSDHLGSTSVVVSQTGVAQAFYYYYPFGDSRSGEFSNLTRNRFTGQYNDSGLGGTSGLSFFGARWYDPQLGRFIQADTVVPHPSDPQSFNRYSYVRNDPVRLIDPSGHGDQCNPTLYNCGTWSSYNAVYHLPWYATKAQKKRASKIYVYRPVPELPAGKTHIVTKYGIVIDTNHAASGRAMQVVNGVNACFSGAACTFTVDLVQSAWKDLWPRGCRGEGCHFLVTYDAKSGFSADQIADIAYGIYQDAEQRFEEAQKTLDWPVAWTSYAAEDMQSDAIAMQIALTSEPLAYVVGDLGGVASTVDEPADVTLSAINKSYDFLYPKVVVNPSHVPAFSAMTSGEWPAWMWLSAGQPSPASAGWWKYKSSSAYYPVCGTNCR